MSDNYLNDVVGDNGECSYKYTYKLLTNYLNIHVINGTIVTILCVRFYYGEFANWINWTV